MFAESSQFEKLTFIFHFSLFIFHLASHAAFHAEGSCNSGHYRRQRLKNKLPSFLFHSSNVLRTQRR